jgi:methylglutaconyl-CoA hydratase
MNDEDIPVKLDIHAGVGTLTLNRPEKRNAFDHLTIATLTELLHHLQSNEHVSIVILKGEGKHFSAGADIHWMRESIKASKEKNAEDSRAFAKLLQTLYHLNKPTIALVQGAAYGGAIGLIACCDIALATFDATFCFSEVKLGMVPAVISPYVLATMHMSAVKRYILTAEVFGAKKARRLGLISEVIESEKMIEKTDLLIENLKNNGPNALRTAKKLIHTLTEAPLLSEVQINYTAHLMAELRTSTEAQEGLAAFLEKRKPKWQME